MSKSLLRIKVWGTTILVVLGGFIFFLRSWQVTNEDYEVGDWILVSAVIFTGFYLDRIKCEKCKLPWFIVNKAEIGMDSKRDPFSKLRKTMRWQLPSRCPNCEIERY